MDPRPKIRLACGGGPRAEEMGPPPKVGGGGGGGDGGPRAEEMGPPPKVGGGDGGSALERTPARAVGTLSLMEEIDWAPKVNFGGGDDDDASPDALKRTDALVQEALGSLPPPPGRGIWLNGARPDDDDPVALALDRRGIHPAERYDPYFDLFMYNRPLKEERLRAWTRFPLKLHDAGLVEAESTMITWGPGLSGRRGNFAVEMTGLLELHPGPITCFRLDSTAFPAPERLKRWVDILTVKEVQQLILINLTRPEETEAPLHYLRSRRLAYLAIGFVNIRACLRLAKEAAELDAHPWSSLKGFTLTVCGFDGPDLSETISNLPGLKYLSILSCPLTTACNEDGLQMKSSSLVTVHLWKCTADHKVTIGPAPALTRLTLGVEPAETASPPPPVRIRIMHCNCLKIVDQLNLQKQDFTIASMQKMTIHYWGEPPVLSFINILSMALELTTTQNALDLIKLLRWLPWLKDLTVRRIDNGTSDAACPAVDSVHCLDTLQHLTMQQFRGGRVEVTFLVEVLAVARSLSTLTVEPHPTPPLKPQEQDATSSVQPHPKPWLHWQDATSYLRSCHRVARKCDIVVVPPTSGKVVSRGGNFCRA